MYLKRFLIGQLVWALVCNLPFFVQAVETSKELKASQGAFVETTVVRFDKPDIRSLHVSTFAGKIVCRAWEKPYIQVTVVKKSRARLKEAAGQELSDVTVQSDTSGRSASVRVRRLTTFTPVRLETFVALPGWLDVRLTTAAGSVSVKGLEGHAKLKTAAGEIEVRQTGGTVTARTGGGQIEARDAEGELSLITDRGQIRCFDCTGSLVCSTGSGDIEILNCQADIAAETDAGDVTIRGCGPNVSVGTAGGNIVASSLSGTLRARTGGGLVLVDKAETVSVTSTAGRITLLNITGTVDAKTGAGPIELEACSAEPAIVRKFELSSGFGDIRVKIPQKLPVDVSVQLETMALIQPRNTVECFFPLQVERQKSSALNFDWWLLPSIPALWDDPTPPGLAPRIGYRSKWAVRTFSRSGWWPVATDIFGSHRIVATGRNLGGGVKIDIRTAQGNVSIQKCQE